MALMPKPMEDVAKVFALYPSKVQQRAKQLRALIGQVAQNHADIAEVQEALKWGEPSYLCKGGSTIRIGWNKKDPEQLRLLCHCQSQLISTYREIYREELSFEGNRAIVLPVQGAWPEDVLTHCMYTALTYHKRKAQPLLGMVQTTD